MMGMKVEVEPEERWYDSYFEIFFSSLIEAAAPSSLAERREASELHGWARDMSSSKHSPVPVPKATMSGRLSLLRYSCLGSTLQARPASLTQSAQPETTQLCAQTGQAPVLQVSRWYPLRSMAEPQLHEVTQAAKGRGSLSLKDAAKRKSQGLSASILEEGKASNQRPAYLPWHERRRERPRLSGAAEKTELTRT